MLAKRLSCFVMILLLFLPTLGLASARNIVVRTEYHSTDTVDERNTYLITIDNKGDIEFKVEALNGSFELYFCDGHTTNSSSYRSRHSADEPVTSFSSALSVGKDDDKMYTINVYNASGRPVDYTISITTYRGDEWVNIFLACGFLILLIVGGIPMLIWWRKQKREFYAEVLRKISGSEEAPAPPPVHHLPKQHPATRPNRHQRQQDLPSLQQPSWEQFRKPGQPPD